MTRHPAPAAWPFAPLTQQQQRRHAALAEAMRAGALSRFPAHLPPAATAPERQP